MIAGRFVGQSTSVAFENRCQILFSLWKSHIASSSACSSPSVGYSNLYVLNDVQKHSCSCAFPSSWFCSRWQHTIWSGRAWPLLMPNRNLDAQARSHWCAWPWECQIYNTLSIKKSESNLIIITWNFHNIRLQNSSWQILPCGSMDIKSLPPKY